MARWSVKLAAGISVDDHVNGYWNWSVRVDDGDPVILETGNDGSDEVEVSPGSEGEGKNSGLLLLREFVFCRPLFELH